MTAAGRTLSANHALAAVEQLSTLGFGVTVPSDLSVINNSKLLTLTHARAVGIDILPTVQVYTREFRTRSEATDLESLKFPVVVKPANWGAGYGVLSASNMDEMVAILKLYSAAELDAVIQPCVQDSRDFRVYCIDGVPSVALVRNSLFASQRAADTGLRYEDIPSELMNIASPLAKRLNVPFVCLDFLVTENSIFLSEMEIDGGTPVVNPVLGKDPRTIELERAKFLAYRRYFESQ